MKKTVIFLCFFIIFLGGCAVAPFIYSPIVTGYIMWKQGEAHKYYNEEVKTMYRATLSSLKELDLKISKNEETKNGYHIVAGVEDKFKIHIEQAKPHITEVRIRINVMGDKPYAELIYTTIDANTNTINYDDEGQPTKLKNKLFRRSADLSR